MENAIRYGLEENTEGCLISISAEACPEKDQLIIYVKKEKMKKVLPASRNIKITDELLGRLYQIFGEKNVKAVEKYIENTGKMH